MKIGIYSKFQCSGGSEYRCAELCNSIKKYTSHEPFLLVRGNKLPKEIKNYLNEDIPVYLNMLDSDDNGNGSNNKMFYEMDKLVIVNSDNYSWTKRGLWEATEIDKDKGGILKNRTAIDLSRIKSMYFLMNFVVSPCQHLWEINEVVKEMGIIVTNVKFFEEITNNKKFNKVRHLPRLISHSPIDPQNVFASKSKSNKIRIGQHSKAFGDKWNEDYPKLIKEINSKYGNLIEWDFMGMKKSVSKNINENNVTIRKENEKSVKDYLQDIDVFLFFPSYKREEPFCRVIEEAMMSGCPIIASNKGGNKQQVVHQNNGFLYDGFDELSSFIEKIINNKDKISVFGKNSKIYSKEYESEKIINKILDFVTHE